MPRTRRGQPFERDGHPSRRSGLTRRAGGSARPPSASTVVSLRDVNLFAGRYELGRLLGTGGTATVYEAQDRRLDRPVAVKLLPAVDAQPELRQRFVREARSAAAFTHPNAVALFDAGESDGHLYLVMELVDGQSLAERLASDGRLEPAAAANVAASVLSALAAAHAVGIVHRDVKPANILLERNGTVKLADFGIAKRHDADDVTIVGDVVGTPKYLAPELLDGAPATPSSDVYATGVVLFEMLAGRPPFDATTPLATALAHREHAVPDLATLRPDVPANLTAAVNRAMAKDPAHRFASAAAMRAQIVGTPQPSEPTTKVALAPTEVIRPGYERGRLARWWALPAAALIALGASIAFLIARGDHPQATAPTAAPPTNAAAPTTTAPPTTAVPPTTAALAITAAAPVGPTSSVSVSPTTRQVADPSTIDGIIVMLQADPAGFGQRAGDVIRDLDKIRSGKGNVGRRAEDLLEHVGEWVENGELDPTVLALLEPVVGPLTEDDEADHGD
jgi:hypothetical protein